MSRPEAHARQGFHELPLVGFTFLATSGGGVGSAYLLLALIGASSWTPGPRVMGLAATLLLGGLLFSLGHLGRPLRAPRALSALGRSPLSAEVVVVGVALGASALSAVLPGDSPVQPWIAPLALASCLATLLAMGLVYRIPGQLTWGGSAFLQPLVLGTAFGLLFHLNGASIDPFSWVMAAVGLMLFADAVLVWRMIRRVEKALGGGEASHPSFLRFRTSLSFLRLALGSLLPALALLFSGPAPALVSVALALALDRTLFYGLGVRHTTEMGIRRVEEVLRKGASPKEEEG